MGKMGEEKNKTDDDILQCRENVLRARDIIPPFGLKKSTPLNKQSAPAQVPEKAPIKISSIPEFEEILPVSGESDIPQFNLAEQIFAEQRKISSGRRQRTSQQNHVERQEQIDKPASFESVKPWQSLSPTTIIPSPASPQQRIIAEIIARDIEEMIIRNSQLER